MLTLLQTQRLVTASELAKRFGVSVRTIYRDMRSLDEAGIPLLTQEGKGYRLLESYRLPPVMLSEQEANAIITAQHILSGTKDTSLVAAYQAAVDKIKAVLSSSTRDQTNLLASRMRTYTNDQSTGGGTYLSALQLALTHYQLVEIHYRSSSGQLSCRRVEAFALLLSSQAEWLLVGWCHLRQTFRIFRLDRMESLAVLDERFKSHPITLKQYFDTLAK